jgi:ZIP family zinc transporter
MGRLSFIPAVVGFWAGILFLLLLDHLIPHLHNQAKHPEGPHSHLKRTTMLLLAVTLHNIPEGMAVGVVYGGLLTGNSTITVAGAFALSIGIAIQNIPEGAIISLPLKASGFKSPKAFYFGVLSGIVEPIAGAITLFASSLITPAMPYMLSFAAGAMIYVVIEDLVPATASGDHSDIGTLFFAFGFSLMMTLDVALG